jgi:CPA1 family monovalent cation:H+ antiporter
VEEGDRAPRGNRVFLVAWTGMRGAISLAAALALPVALPTGEPFPARDFIVFVTFAVIVLTLVAQGASLPFLIRALGLDKEGRRETEKSTRLEYEARIRMVEAALARLDALCREGKIAPEAADWYRDDLEHRRGTYQRHRTAHPDRGRRKQARGEMKALIEVAAAERDELLQLRSAGKIDDDTMHRIERDLDEQELRLESRRERLR